MTTIHVKDENSGNLVALHSTKEALIADGETESAAVSLDSLLAVVFYLPAGFDGTALSFQVSPDGETYYPLYGQEDAAVSLTVAASRAYRFPYDLWGIHYLKFVAGTAQTGDVTILVETF